MKERGWGTWIRTKINGVRVPSYLFVFNGLDVKHGILHLLDINGLEEKCKTVSITDRNLSLALPQIES
jgi:hypothetical protein